MKLTSAKASCFVDFIAGSDTTDATWTAVDSDADTYLDQLVIDFGSGNKVTIEDYFDNTTTDDDTSGAGSGFIESLVFDDDASVNLTEAQALIV